MGSVAPEPSGKTVQKVTWQSCAMRLCYFCRSCCAVRFSPCQPPLIFPSNLISSLLSAETVATAIARGSSRNLRRCFEHALSVPHGGRPARRRCSSGSGRGDWRRIGRQRRGWHCEVRSCKIRGRRRDGEDEYDVSETQTSR